MGVAVALRIGVFGGTFDPVHLGHLIIAEDARAALRLDKVLFIPAGEPWFKADMPVTPAEHRLAMVRLAAAGNPHFAVSDIEVRRCGPSYTADTLAELAAEYPEAEFYVVLGADSLRDIDRWSEPERVYAMARVVGMARPGASLDMAALEAAIPGAAERTMLLHGAQVDISATDIRRRVGAGESIRYRVPPPVEAYIRRHRLYGGESGCPS